MSTVALPPVPHVDPFDPPCLFLRSLFPEIDTLANDARRNRDLILTALFERASMIAAETLPNMPLEPRPTVEEVVSDIICTFASGSVASGFDPLRGDANGYLVGIVRKAARRLARTQRLRQSTSLEAASSVADTRSTCPSGRASQAEVLEVVRGFWPTLTAKRQAAIMAQFGDVLGSGASPTGPNPKNYCATHHGVQQLKRMFTSLGIVEW